MPMKFSGSFGALRTMLDRHAIGGSWEEEPNGVTMLRCPDGANLHWASGSKSLWIDGKPGPRQMLELRIARISGRRFKS